MIVLSVLGWAVVTIVLAGAAVGATTLVARACPNVVVAVAQLLLPWWTVGAAAVVAWSASAGRWWLVVVAAAVALLGAAVVGSRLRPRRRAASGSAGSAGRPTVSVVLANLYLDNPEPDEAIGQLLERRPDVLVMTELTDELVARFDRLGGATDYAHRIHPEPIEGEYVPGIFARRPLLDADVVDRAELRTVEASVQLDGEHVRVMVAHPEAPSTLDGFRMWRRQLRRLQATLRDSAGPMVALGDLNSGTLQAPYEDLLRTRFRDAHADAGRSLVPSWGIAPWMPRWVPTFVARLDHLLVSPELEVVELEDLEAVGSDHRPFCATVALAARTGR